MKHQRKPDTRAIWMSKCLRHNPDDRVRCAVDHQNAANNVGAGAEICAPEIVADDYDGCVFVAAFLGTEIAAESGRYFQNIEEVCCNLRGRDGLRSRTVNRTDHRNTARTRTNGFKRVFAKLREMSHCRLRHIERGGTISILIKRFKNPAQPIGMPKRQWSQERAFNDRENCYVGPN